jgi:hypothetical protein
MLSFSLGGDEVLGSFVNMKDRMDQAQMIDLAAGL